jgi:bifunctional non-homologous end joining protein LigD
MAERVAGSGGSGGGYVSRMTSIAAPKPALATLTHEPFFEPGWVYERKLDGERCLATKQGGEVVLWSRSGRQISGSFPEIVEALEGQPEAHLAVDGEIVAFEGSRTSFAKLQPRIQVSDPVRARATGVPVWYYVFDLLEAGSDDVRGEPLLRRKSRLRKAVRFGSRLRFTPHRVNAGPDYLAAACSKGWEGLIAKRADAPYVAGRTRNWLKFKCESGQEFVIGGFTDPEGSRTGFGALLLGYYRDGELVYAGKVGTGFSYQLLADLRRRLDELEIPSPPFDRGRLPTKAVHWVRPELVCEVSFTEWTSSGQLRHPRFIGLRRDKSPAEVVRE